jgi:hypothetical protein
MPREWHIIHADFFRRPIVATRRTAEPDLGKFSPTAWRMRYVSLETAKTCLSEA